MQDDDKVTALETQTAELKDQLAALERRLGATEQRRAAHEQVLEDLVAGKIRVRELTFDDNADVGRVEVGIERNGAGWAYVERDRYGDILEHRPLAPTPEEAEAQRAREAVEQQRVKERRDALAYLAHHETAVRFPLGALRDVLKVANAVMDSDAAPLRRVLPGLEQSIERVRALVEREPWPDGEERLRGQQHPPTGEAMLADARAALAEFDRRMAEQEQMRRRRLESGAAR